MKSLRKKIKLADGKTLSQEKLAYIVGMKRSTLAEFESFNGKGLEPEVEQNIIDFFGLPDKESLYKK